MGTHSTDRDGDGARAAFYGRIVAERLGRRDVVAKIRKAVQEKDLDLLPSIIKFYKRQGFDKDAAIVKAKDILYNERRDQKIDLEVYELVERQRAALKEEADEPAAAITALMEEMNEATEKLAAYTRLKFFETSEGREVFSIIISELIIAIEKAELVELLHRHTYDRKKVPADIMQLQNVIKKAREQQRKFENRRDKEEAKAEEAKAADARRRAAAVRVGEEGSSEETGSEEEESEEEESEEEESLAEESSSRRRQQRR